MKAYITIKTGRNIPKLGLTNLPSPYIIMQISGKQDVTKICPNTCNPNWNYQTEVSCDDLLQKVMFYVYNNNTNYVDELLGYGSTQFQTLMTPTLTNSRIMLQDSQGNYLNSYIQLQHNNTNPPPNRAILNQRTTIRINLLGITSYSERAIDWLNQFKNKNITIGYGSQTKNLNQNVKMCTLIFDQSQAQIQVRLDLSSDVALKGVLLVDNIIGNSSFRLKLYYNTYEVIAMIGASIINNGLLPQKHNTLIVQLTNIIVQPLKKIPKQWTVAIHSVFGKQIITSLKQPTRLYIQNNTYLQFDYFDEKIDAQNVLNYQPLASYLIPINSIDWADSLNLENNIKLYNPGRGIVINIDLRYTIVKNTTESNLIPKFDKPATYMEQQKAIYKVTEIKMSGACFFQIFPDKTIFTFVYISNNGVKTVFSSFIIKNSTQYSILCRQNIAESGTGGTLYMVTYDHYFGNGQGNYNQFENYVVLKIICKNMRDISEGQVVFHQKFLSFAKKQTLVKPCKKFDQMVKDKLLSVKLIMKRFAYFQPGLLTINNCMVQGTKNKVDLSIIFDSNQLNLSGDSGNYMLTKPYTVKIKDNGIQFKLKNQHINKQIHYQMEQIFGQIEQKKSYSTSILIGDGISVKIIYRFKLSKIEKGKQKLEKVERFQINTPLNIKIKSAFVKTDGLKCFRLRVNKASTTYETLQQNPTSSLIRFRDCQIMYFEKSAVNNYIFFNLYSSNQQGGLVIYAGHYPVKNIIGKGFYQITMSKMGEQQNKNMALVIFQVMNNAPLEYPVVRLSIKELKYSHQEFVKNIMKYYLVAQIKNATVGLFELNRNNQIFLTNETVSVKNGDSVVWRLYSSSKMLSKEGFWSSQKQLVASYKQMWAEVQLSGVILLRFQSPKDLNSKLSSNRLALIQNYVTVSLQYVCQPQQMTQVLPNNKIAKPIDVEVLPSGAAKINILQIIPFSSHQKTIEIKLMPFQFQFCSQSRIQLNKQFLLELPNMKAKLSVLKSSKYKDKYNRENSQTEVNFRGKKCKTMEKIGFSVLFPGLCILKADAIILSNKFTNNFHGELKLLTFGCNSNKIKQIEIYGLKNPNQIRRGLEKTPSLKLNINENKTALVNKSFETNQITFCLHFVLTLEDKQKIRTTLQVAQINIEKLETKAFRHEWVVQSKGVFVLYIEAEYNSVKVEQVSGQTANYSIQIDGQMTVIPIQYKTQQKISLIHQAQKMDSFRPDRKRGFRVIVNIPKLLQPQSVGIILHDDSLVTLRKAEHNAKTYVYNSQKQCKVKSIKINCEEVVRIQQLEQKNFTRRFLVNRNPSLVVLLSQQHYAIADCTPQSVVVNFQFHKIYSKQRMNKIMWVKSNKNDEILTRHFGLLIRHGKQKRIIRSINQTGQFQKLNNNQQTMSFGFDPYSDQLQVFLYIDHVLNQNQEATTLDCEKLQNWTKLFPVAYGKILLEKIGKNTLVGCQLKGMENYNQTLDQPLSKIFQFSNLLCLGAVSMERRHWGLIELQLQQISGIQLDFSSQNTLIYFQIQVESSQRTKITGMVTEARCFNKESRLAFVTKKLNFFYMQQKGETQSLKIVAMLLTSNNSFKLFQKRVDISQYLRQPGTHPIKTQIKPSQCQGVKNLVQIKLTMDNKATASPELNMIQEAKKINKVDMISFQNYKQKQLLFKLLQCQLPSHLIEVLNQIKQSVIYSKESQLLLFRMCGYYLQFQNDEKILTIIIQMMNIEVFKYPETINRLDSKDVRKMYEYIKIIFFSRALQLPKLQKKITTADYDSFIQKIDISKFDQNIKFQKKKLYKTQQMNEPALLAHCDHLLPLIEAFIDNSEDFRSVFKQDVKQWNDSIIHKQDSIFVKYLYMLEQVFINQKIPQEILQDILDKALQKQISSQPIINIWSKLTKQKMSASTSLLFNKIISKLDDSKQSIQRVQSLRTFINYLQSEKIVLEGQYWKRAVNKCVELLTKSSDFIILNLYSELIIRINSLGLMNQNDKAGLIGVIKKRNLSQNDKNSKLILTNLIDKIIGKKTLTTQETTSVKNQFYKKYLITS